MRIVLIASACWLAGCSTARLVPSPPINIPDSGVQRVVVVEPFFESSQWQCAIRPSRTSPWTRAE